MTTRGAKGNRAKRIDYFPAEFQRLWQTCVNNPGRQVIIGHTTNPDAEEILHRRCRRMRQTLAAYPELGLAKASAGKRVVCRAAGSGHPGIKIIYIVAMDDAATLETLQSWTD